MGRRYTSYGEGAFAIFAFLSLTISFRHMCAAFGPAWEQHFDDGDTCVNECAAGVEPSFHPNSAWEEKSASVSTHSYACEDGKDGAPIPFRMSVPTF